MTLVSGSDSDLETVLYKFLGFSPKLLGLKLTIGEDIGEALKASLGENVDGEISKEARLINKFCNLGESFARVNDPEFFPGATKQWRNVVEEITSFLGPNGLSLLKDRVGQFSTHYVTVAPKILEMDLSPEKNAQLATEIYATNLLEMNPYATRCPDFLKAQFLRVYSMVKPGKVSPEALQILVSDLIPAAGFLQGCIYVADAKGDHLVPKLRIGVKPLSHYKTVACDDNAGANPIADALFSSVPIKQDEVLIYGENVSHVSGSIGNGEKIGVLYLELSDGLVNDTEINSMLSFKAIRHCLVDCLSFPH